MTDMEQLYAIQVDLCKQHPENAEIYLQAGDARYVLHSGARWPGARGGLYTSKQLSRIIGKYAEGAAKAIPVAFGTTQAQKEQCAQFHARNAFWIDCLDEVGIPEDVRKKAQELFTTKENPYE